MTTATKDFPHLKPYLSTAVPLITAMLSVAAVLAAARWLDDALDRTDLAQRGAAVLPVAALAAVPPAFGYDPSVPDATAVFSGREIPTGEQPATF